LGDGEESEVNEELWVDDELRDVGEFAIDEELGDDDESRIDAESGDEVNSPLMMLTMNSR
jgi:hypothetical protein